MPSVLREDGYRFFFWSNENDEPAHIHVQKGGGEAKLWLNAVALVYSHRFSAHETRVIAEMVERHRADFERAWDEYFGTDEAD